WYLTQALINGYGLSLERANETLNAIPIIHLHGRLGGLEERAYEPTDDVKIIRKAAESIQVLHEGVETSTEFEQARGAIGKSGRVYFIGFGYHQTNLARLRIQKTLSAGARIFG